MRAHIDKYEHISCSRKKYEYIMFELLECTSIDMITCSQQTQAFSNLQVKTTMDVGGFQTYIF
jgi:hypothetical protein